MHIYIYTNIKKHGSTYIFEKYPPKNATCLICKITLGGCESVITTRNEATSQCTVPPTQCGEGSRNPPHLHTPRCTGPTLHFRLGRAGIVILHHAFCVGHVQCPFQYVPDGPHASRSRQIVHRS